MNYNNIQLKDISKEEKNTIYPFTKIRSSNIKV